jgi:FkbM family methyltransferase
MAHHPDLIFDVGVANGNDSAYYLHKGYRVVGVEANPLQLPALRERFETEIREGRYHLVPIAIAEVEGEAEFWICDDEPEWSSFDRSIASYKGSRHHSVRVQTCPFRSVLEQFGTPFYCKIDIEGNDDLCVSDLAGPQRPPFVSIELDSGEPQIRLLERQGYTRFKIISQRTLRQPHKTVARLKTHLPLWLLKQAFRVETKLLRRPDGDWRFPNGSSGRFGEETPGDWLTADEAIELNRTLELAEYYDDWYDIHAALSIGTRG